MNLPPASPTWRTIYERVAPLLAIMCLLIALLAAVGTYMNSRADEKQDDLIAEQTAARGKDNAQLLACFDAFATALAGGLPPVREATAARDQALAEALTALQDLLSKAIHGNTEPGDADPLVEALTAYRAANAALEQVREENPYPEAPSEFCADELP